MMSPREHVIQLLYFCSVQNDAQRYTLGVLRLPPVCFHLLCLLLSIQIVSNCLVFKLNFVQKIKLKKKLFRRNTVFWLSVNFLPHPAIKRLSVRPISPVPLLLTIRNLQSACIQFRPSSCIQYRH